jgi:hypothetical protein
MILQIIILKEKNFRKREIYDIKHEIAKKFKSNKNIRFSLEEMNSKILIIANDMTIEKVILILNKTKIKIIFKN